MDPKKPTAGRIDSLDQFRGYTVAAMLLVNFLGGYQAVPALLKHHNTYCSYADTVMPQFFFAVGAAYRLTFLRRVEALGAWKASAAVVQRCLGLMLVGFVLYHLDGGVKSWAELRALGIRGFLGSAFGREPFEALVHIALASLSVLPVIAAGPLPRAAFLAASAALHAWLSSRFYFDWVWNRPGIDGGPLGFLTWSIPLLVGSFAYDEVAGPRGGAPSRLALWGVVLMAVGYGLSCLGGAPAAPPFHPPSRPVDLWTMSQRGGTVSYQVFASGFALALYAGFVAACDRGRLQLGLFRTFGRNALAAYVLHGLVADAVKPFVPKDAPGWYVAAGFALYFAINYVFVHSLEKDGIYLRL
jgi:predicted acyltransferase